MAQAARLSMRMQKELKLLLSDPPHGASFPHLSSAASGSGDFSSFSTIDAEMEGPEDTVYANGIFKVKIEIPERYPFQPPIVSFATPIYHPNIDNSGRICLDILNLPPKGAWQPSLNISTVLTSIGLLLSDPNPDDGLMCEVSREYKYNRQTFDYKAREMTQKYASKVKAGQGSLLIQEISNAGEVKSHGDDKVSESGNSVLARNHEKPDAIKTELAVESSLSITHDESSDTVSQLHISSSIDKQVDGNGKRKETTGNNGGSRKKLSLALPPHSQKKDLCGEELTHEVSAAFKENKKPHSTVKKLSLGLNKPLVDAASLIKNSASSSFRSSDAKSDNNRLNRKLSLRPIGESQVNEVSNAQVFAQTEIMNQNQDERSWGSEFEKPVLEEASMPESFVVLDSEESGDEEDEATVPLRSRLSLARRALKCGRP